MVKTNFNISEEDEIRQLLAQLPDPEIPVISIIDLGIVRSVEINNNQPIVAITPTYSGCPAMKQIENDIKKLLIDAGYDNPAVKLVYEPAWTTDWLSNDAKERLRKYGIAPPEHTSVDKSSITGKPNNIACPRCNSKNVKMISQFGSTACKALYQCNDCFEPFDYFKCI